MEIDTPTIGCNVAEAKKVKDVFDADDRGRGCTPIPGGFPEEDLIEDYMSRPQSHQQTPTQTNNDPGGSSLRGNWVMVNEPYADLEGSPARKRPRPSTAQLTSDRHREPLAHDQDYGECGRQ